LIRSGRSANESFTTEDTGFGREWTQIGCESKP
jgi:hypothetical protein